MPVTCVAYGCKNRGKPGRITFHSFPKDEERLSQWVTAIRRKDWKPSKYSKLCSVHFREADLDRTSLSCVRIREGVVPCIFPVSNTKDRHPSKRRHEDQADFKKNKNRSQLQDTDADPLNCETPRRKRKKIKLEEENADSPEVISHDKKETAQVTEDVSEIEIQEPNIFIKMEVPEPEDLSPVEIEPDSAVQEPFETVLCDIDIVKHEAWYEDDIDVSSQTTQNDYTVEKENCLYDEIPLVKVEVEEQYAEEDSMKYYVDEPIKIEEPGKIKGEDSVAKKASTDVKAKASAGVCCILCGKRLSRILYLVDHLLRLHPEAGISKLIMAEKAKTGRRDKEINRLVTLYLSTAPEQSQPQEQGSSSILTSPLSSSSTDRFTSVKDPLVASLPCPEINHDPNQDSSYTTSLSSTQDVSTFIPFPSHLSELNSTAWDSSNMFCLMLPQLPLDTRISLKKKMLEMVKAVANRKLDPEKVIIAYRGLETK